MISSIFNPQPYYYYLVLRNDDLAVQVPIPSDLSPEMTRKTIDAGLKRFGQGFLKTIGIYTPDNPSAKDNEYLQRYLQTTQARHFQALTAKLQQDHSTVSLDLKKGVVPENIDIMVLVAPNSLSDKELFAVDQFLMRGGTIILATSPFAVDPPFDLDPSNGFSVRDKDTGLKDWLNHYGVNVQKKFVLDEQCDHYIVAVKNNNRNLNFINFELKEYPYFISVRSDGLNQNSPITSGLSQVAMGWASPIDINYEKIKDRKITEIIHSSKNSWVSDSKNIMPDYTKEERFGIAEEGLKMKRLLGAVIEGSFESYFKGKESPLVIKEQKKSEGDNDKKNEKVEEEPDVFAGQIDQSPESARIIVFSSNEFVADETLQIFANINGNAYVTPLQLFENTVDWALEDPVLLSIRARERFARTLIPMTSQTKSMWEYLFCYGGSLLGLLIVFILHNVFRNIRISRWSQYAN